MTENDTDCALTFNSMLEFARADEAADVIKKLKLNAFSSCDFQDSAPLVVVDVQDYSDHWRCFWFLEAKAAVQSVMGRDSKTFYPPPQDNLILIDERSPRRIVETLRHYLSVYP
jgi:hypothetical protein